MSGRSAFAHRFVLMRLLVAPSDTGSSPDPGEIPQHLTQRRWAWGRSDANTYLRLMSVSLCHIASGCERVLGTLCAAPHASSQLINRNQNVLDKTRALLCKPQHNYPADDPPNTESMINLSLPLCRTTQWARRLISHILTDFTWFGEIRWGERWRQGGRGVHGEGADKQRQTEMRNILRWSCSYTKTRGHGNDFIRKCKCELQEKVGIYRRRDLVSLSPAAQRLQVRLSL